MFCDLQKTDVQGIKPSWKSFVSDWYDTYVSNNVSMQDLGNYREKPLMQKLYYQDIKTTAAVI